MKKIIVLVYNSFKDPLFQSNLFLYLKEYSIHNPTKSFFLLITYEQVDFPISETEIDQIKNQLKAQYNIIWIPLTWHSGRFKLLKKAFDFTLLSLYVFVYRILGFSKIVSLGTVAGAFAHILSKVYFLDHFLYQYEPHSEFVEECGVWTKKSFSFRMLNYFEQLAGMQSKVLATGTRYMIERLQKWKSPAKVFLVPSCVDTEKFVFLEAERKNIRNTLNIENRKVILYLGKFGGIYYGEELISFFAALYRLDSSYFFLIVSRDSSEMISKWFSKNSLPSSSYHITASSFLDVPKYISAADFGVVSVPPLPSQKFRSPIKVGEYLCCGIPYIVCKGISEDDVYANQFNVGVVIDRLEPNYADEAHHQMNSFFAERKNDLRTRCRNIGIDYRGFQKLKHIMNQAFDEL